MEIRLTPRELDLMAVLWDRGPCTVAEVREAIEDDLAYTTVLTILRVMEEKEYVSHTAEGKAHRYLPLIERSKAGASAVRRVTRRLFKDSPELLLTHLVEDERLTEEEIRRMRDLLNRRLEEDDQ